MAQDLGQALSWEGDAQTQDSQFELLPAGDYDFEVTGLKHERFDGSEKMAACPVAVVQLRCTGDKASGTVFDRLFLNTKTLWRITKFLKGAGLLDPDTPEGTRFPLSLFDQAVGCTGKCSVTITKSKSNGREYENNNVDYKIPPKRTTTAPAPQRAPQQQSWGGNGF
jgi:hypothetical protein